MTNKSTAFCKLLKKLVLNPHFCNVRLKSTKLVKIKVMENYDNVIKERIKDMRAYFGYSQQKVATKGHFTIDTYKKIEARIERGGVKITCQHIHTLCKIYKLETADFFIFGKDHR